MQNVVKMQGLEAGAYVECDDKVISKGQDAKQRPNRK